MKGISEITKKPVSIVQYIIERYHELQIFENRDQSGRPPKLNRLHKINILHKVQDNPQISAPQVATDLMVKYNIKVAPQISRNVLKK